MGTSRPVIVKRMPDRINLQQARDFQREVQPLLRSDRPQLVFDFSAVRRMDAAGVDMLLECMSEVMKHDGDLKLAALSPQAAVVLELTRADRLFEIYETVSDAVRSFSGFLPNAMRKYAEWGVTAPSAADPRDEAPSNLAA
ncbi:MAG TPA: STAS domain-containing protein [Terriglobales bacterium]|nr:STAS domain-containing protein [Terriglobales bacterium]